ncbi:MAG: hypothetical protein ACXU8N_06205 [Telluria sp.]
MRKLTLAAFVAAASLSSFAYAAGGSAAAAYSTAAGTASLVKVQAAATHRYKVQPGEFEQFAGHYSLSDGHQLTVTADRVGKFYAQVDDQPKAELISLTPTTFVGRDANIKLDFQASASNAPAVLVSPIEG